MTQSRRDKKKRVSELLDSELTVKIVMATELR
jgi:hypothetical protein